MLNPRQIPGIKSLKNESGFGMMDVMIVGAILLILVGSYATFQFQRSKAQKAQDTRNVYNQLKSNLESGAAQAQALQKSEQLTLDQIK